MTIPPSRNWARVAKATSRSRSVLALSTCSSIPSVRAAARIVFVVGSAMGGLAGLTRTASAVAEGTSSCRSWSCFDPTSTPRVVTPVTLPPGRGRLATSPSLTGSTPVAKTIGIVVVNAFAASAPSVLPGAAITAT